MSATSTQGPLGGTVAQIGDTHRIAYTQRHGKDTHVEARCLSMRADAGLDVIGRVLTDEGDHFAIRWQRRGTYIYRRLPRADDASAWRDEGILILIL
jgi:hypothetical protein